MRLGFIMLSHVCTPERDALVKWSFDSLSKTSVDGLERPMMVLLNTSSGFDYDLYLERWEKKWDVKIAKDVEAIGMRRLVNLHVAGVDEVLKHQRLNNLQVIGADEVLKNQDVTHIYFMHDDFIYNPDWLRQLIDLIGRHQGALAWSVYRSSFEQFHRIIGGDGLDVLMSAHDGIGAMTREAWLEYQTAAAGDYGVPGFGEVCSMDVHYSYFYPGDRWATSRDWIQNIGVHDGFGRSDQAIDFVGE